MADKFLTGDDILLIKQTNIWRNYDSQTEGFKDKKYRIYAFGENAFAVHEDDSFHKDFEDGEIQKVLITVDKEGWSLANHVTFKRAIGQKTNQAKLDAISVENYKPQPVSAELLNAIG